MGFVETDNILPQGADDEAKQFCKYGFSYECPYSVLTHCDGIRCAFNGVLIRRFDKTGKANNESVKPKRGDMGRRHHIKRINFK